MSKYPYKNLGLINPDFGSSLIDLIIGLDILREKRLSGTTPPLIFFQLKSLFHTLESLGSARIEGNRTTIIDFLETKIDKSKPRHEEIKEIQNGEEALAYIDEVVNTENFQVDERFIKELQKKVVNGLSLPPKGEGDHTPGEYRKKFTFIDKAKHTPPQPLEVQYYMDELIDFFNKKDKPKYDLLKIALFHHRFVWIHPFGNGNGRTVRLLTYAQLVKAGFRVHVGGRVINPTAVFCSDRNKYYEQLANADSGTNQGLISWCEYVLEGLRREIEKIDKLTDYTYLSREVLLPAVNYSLERKFVTDIESSVLKIAIKEGVFEASHISHLFPDKPSSYISKFLRKMKEKKLIVSETKNGRKYLINFGDNYLVRGVIKMLEEKGFLPLPLNG